MINFIKRYVCKSLDYDNKVTFYQVIVKEVDEQFQETLEWHDIVISGAKHFYENTNFDKLIKAKVELKKEDWDLIKDKLYDKCELIDCENNPNAEEIYVTGLQQIKASELHKFLMEKGKKLDVY